MPRIKITYPFPGWPLIRQTPASSGTWGNIFFINPDETENAKGFDAWFILDKLIQPKESTLCPAENIVCITWEPPTIRKYSNLFLRQFPNIITCHRNIRHPHKNYMQGHPWFVNKPYDELAADILPQKTKQVSVITSNKQFSEGHKRRYEFCMHLKEYFGDVIDLFGRGLNDFDDKWDVVAPYRYSIAVENADVDDWITEKLFDCYLAACFPFFYGCPDIEKYFSAESFLRINIYKEDEAKKLIEQTLQNEKHFETHLPALLKAKADCLNRFNIFPLMAMFYRENLAQNTKSNWQTVKHESALFYRLTKRIF